MKTHLVIDGPFSQGAFTACGKRTHLLGAHQVDDAAVLLGLPSNEVCKICLEGARKLRSEPHPTATKETTSP